MHAANTWGMIWSLLCDILIFSSSEFVENCHDISFCHVTVKREHNKIKYKYILLFAYTVNYFHTHLCLDVTIKAATPLHPLVKPTDWNERHCWSLKASINKENKAYPTNQEQSSQPP